MKVLDRTLAILLAVQLFACILSAGFSPAILLAFGLMPAAPVSLLKAMPVRGIAFLALPCVTGAVLFQGMILSPIFLGWFAINLVAAVISFNRGPGAPRLRSAGSR